MIKLKNNEIFFYLEQSYPLQRSLNQKIFSKTIYPPLYCATSNLIRNFGGCRGFPEVEKNKRISGNSLEELASKIQDFELSELKNVSYSLISNPDYSSSFFVDGTHSDIWKHIQKGVDLKTLEKIKEYMQGNVNFPLLNCSIMNINLNND